MSKKLLLYGAGVLAVVAIALLTTTLRAEKVGLAEVTVQEGAVVDRAILQQALAHSADCAGFTVTGLTPIGKGKVLARIAGMRGQCCLDPAKTALKRVTGVEAVSIELQRN